MIARQDGNQIKAAHKQARQGEELKHSGHWKSWWGRDYCIGTHHNQKSYVFDKSGCWVQYALWRQQLHGPTGWEKQVLLAMLCQQHWHPLSPRYASNTLQRRQARKSLDTAQQGAGLWTPAQLVTTLHLHFRRSRRAIKGRVLTGVSEDGSALTLTAACALPYRRFLLRWIQICKCDCTTWKWRISLIFPSPGYSAAAQHPL